MTQTFKGLAAEPYFLSVRAPGYEIDRTEPYTAGDVNARRQFYVPEGQTLKLKVVLRKK